MAHIPVLQVMSPNGGQGDTTRVPPPAPIPPPAVLPRDLPIADTTMDDALITPIAAPLGPQQMAVPGGAGRPVAEEPLQLTPEKIRMRDEIKELHAALQERQKQVNNIQSQAYDALESQRAGFSRAAGEFEYGPVM